MSDPIFTFTSINPFGLSNVGGFANPTFADIDRDNDLDAYIGSYSHPPGGISTGKILFFKNTGTASNPVFAPFSIDPFLGSNFSSYPAPNLVDIDSDSDLDAFVSYGAGKVGFYRNTGTPSNPVFAGDDSEIFGNGLVVWGIARNTFGDIDDDGDLDAYVGNQLGQIIFFRNTGTASNPVFADASFDPYGLNRIKITFDAASPTLVDIDNDGDLDAFVGWKSGNIQLNRNIGTSSSPDFNLEYDDSSGTFGLSNVGGRASPAFADIDGDGDLDAFIGNQNGDILFFTNSTNGTTSPPIIDETPPTIDGAVAAAKLKAILDENKKPLENIEEAGQIQLMADFSKAAYNLEKHENSIINDFSPFADNALAAVKARGWEPLNLDISLSDGSFPFTNHDNFNSKEEIILLNGMSNGFYTNGNAAAFVARSGDAVVIAFRGTNDNGENPTDPKNGFYPDQDDWSPLFEGSGGKIQHYYMLKPLISALDSFVSDSSNGINKVYVTGHSLGGAMASEYMQAPNHKGDKYSAITFAAPAFGVLDGFFKDEDRVTHIEIDGDIVPDVPGFHPGRSIHFAGNDTHTSIVANHSMDYYRQITKSIDMANWAKILSLPNDSTVLLGADVIADQFEGQEIDRFIVDGLKSGTNEDFENGDDVLTDPAAGTYDFFYGGRGNDELNGGVNNDIMFGGSGNDMIDGSFGIDTASYSDTRANYALSLNEGFGPLADQLIVADYWTALDSDGTDTLENIERLIFTDSGVAFDINDSGSHAGQVAKMIGAVFGAEYVTNTDFIATGLYYLDNGVSYEGLVAEAISFTGAKTPEQVVTLLWSNVVGSPPTTDQLQPIVNDLVSGKYTTGSLGVLAADHEINQANINLTGLVANGIAFDPSYYQPIG